MRLPLEWLLEQFAASREDLSQEAIATCLMAAGFELEAVEYVRPGLETVVTGKLLTADAHPNADRLRVCRTDVGRDQPLQIITAAPNVKAGDIVPVALVGSKLPSGKDIGEAKMRGVDSFGMFCSAVELGLDQQQAQDRALLRNVLAKARPDLAGDEIEKAVDLCFEFVMVLPAGTGLGQPIANVLHLGDAVADVAITANRGDALSVRGLAREMSAHAFHPIKWEELPAPEARPGAAAVVVKLDDPDLCPRYAGQVVRGIEVGPSPDWLSRRLDLAGIRAINNVVDALNFVMLEIGQPMHAFDLAKLRGAVAARRARAGERILTLDEQDRELEEGMLVIADDAGPIAVAGVMGGLASAVSSETTDILLESAYFTPSAVRRTAKKLALASESSYRFERGVDPENTGSALEHAARLVVSLAGGTLDGPQVDARHEGFPAELVVELRPSRADKVLGLDIPEATQVAYLGRLGFEEVPGHAALPAIAFRVPGWRRHDVTREIDLIEEVARIAGYDQVPETLPKLAQPPAIRREVHERLRPILRGAGFSEIVSPPLSGQALQAKVLGGTSHAVSLTNPLSDMGILRLSLLPSLLEVARINFNQGAERIALFEVGRTYRREWGSNTESLQVAALAVGDLARGLWKRAPEVLQADFGWSLGVAESVLGALGLGDLAPVSDAEQPGFHPGRCARFEFEGRILAVFGEIHPLVAERFDLPGSIRTAAVVFYPEIVEAACQARPRRVYKPIPRFPAITRDVALLLDDGMPAGDLVRVAREAGGPLLEEARLFDRYQGPQVPAGKVSLALALRYRSGDRTLTDAEVEAVHQTVVARLRDRFGAEQRV
ncbi:MAG: phenylalanine--tRNA ligase subunit beta [Candidatus Sericytochromatia bacterium]|nr:phenylalanine--tRNA ligase subunit beta [Candidatus Tanganyikabacteria bacterium]